MLGLTQLANVQPLYARNVPKANRPSKRNEGREITAKGKTRTIQQWADILGCTRDVIYKRIQKGMSEQEAVTTPLMSQADALKAGQLKAREAMTGTAA